MRRIRPRVVVTLGALALAVLFGHRYVSAPLDTGRTVTGAAELVGGGFGRGLIDTVRGFVRTGTLTRRVKELELDVARLTADAARLESLKEENTQLRQALGLPARASLRLVFADVLGPATDGASTALRINRGAADGLVDRAPVLAADSIVVGRLSHVLAHTATVDLLTSGRVRVAVRDLATDAEGLVRGIRGLDVIVESIPRTAEVRPGDQLVTTGIDGVFPPHLLVGTVRSVRAPEHAVFQEASIQLPLDLLRLRLVAAVSTP